MVFFIFFLVAFWVAPTIATIFVVPCYCTTKNITKAKYYSVCLAFFYSIVGYCFKDPKTDPDLVRYIQMLGQYRGKTLVESFNLAYDNLFSLDIWFHILSKFDNDQLLPASYMFVFYLVVFYVLSDYRIRKNISNNHFILYLLFTILSINLGCILNTFRSNIAFVLFFLALYREMIQHKKNLFTFLLYIFSFFLHFAVITLIALRLALLIKNRKLLITTSAMIIFVPRVLEAVGSKTLGLVTDNIAFNQLVYFINRANMYFRWTEGGWAETVSKSGYYKVERIYYLIIMLFFIYVCIQQYRTKRKSESFNLSMLKNYQVYGIMYIAVTLVSFFITAPEYNRFISPFIPFACILFFDYWGDYYLLKKNSYIVPLLMLGGFGIITNTYFMNTFVSVPEFVLKVFFFVPILG